MEPFQEESQLEQYRRALGMQYVMRNPTNKIWVFCSEEWDMVNVSYSGQELTLKFSTAGRHREILISSIYARCDALERLELWVVLEEISSQNHIPWIVGGDFNVIRYAEEKLGGLPVTQEEIVDFENSISACVLAEVNFFGSNYTWWNGKIRADCTFKRLDRILQNHQFLDMLPNSRMDHLVRQGSDHVPIQLTCSDQECPVSKLFKFLNFWAKHKDYKELIQTHWKVDFVGCAMVEYHAKIKRVKTALANWSRQKFGNIFRKIDTLEDILQVKEDQFEIDQTEENRTQLKKAG